ncbi:LamG domain-containing protein [Sphingobacterium sp. SGG-5]|uniref:LamG domain-containing protein n=1 Tax=Sphingobacterium sp. SGG-5 TaxID=2710881 RepID=UPI0013EB5596|nr:LamG domain-containing protein [Sphingobacterium sp. SGG-5]NGM63581.1 LamG domain-containing protein [Sphingobacterium sp. SGG-5]
MHSAFPDLIRFKNAFYVAFREGPAHGGANGVIRILKSIDGDNWETVQVLELTPAETPPSTGLAFNGTNQYMTIEPHADFTFTNSQSFSVSGWIYTANTSYTQIVSTRQGANGYDFAQQVNKIISDMGIPYLRTEQLTGDLTSNTWHHVGYVYNGSTKQVKLYLNGVAVALSTNTSYHPQTAVTTQANTYGNKITVFAKADNTVIDPSGLPTSGFTTGKISTLRFWNKALTHGEMAADQTSKVTAATPNLIAAYDFGKKQQQGSNTIVPDIKGNHPGVLKNFSTNNLVPVPGPAPSDLRDPKLSITPDNRIMVLMDGEMYNDGIIINRRPYVSYSDANGSNFSEVVRSDVHYPTDSGLSNGNFWIWNARWSNNSLYGVDYVGGKFVLFNSIDTGRAFRTHKILDRVLLGNPSETDLVFDKNNKMHLFIRRNGAGNALATSKGYLATSTPPYTSWMYSELDYRLEGPNVLMLDDHNFCIATRRFDESNSNPQMGILVTDLNGTKKKEIILPSSGDCGYAGMVIHDGYLWIVYYSSHEGVSSIYSSKIPVSNLVDYLAFNGVNQSMMIDHHTDFDYTATDNFSISGWILQENAIKSTFSQFVSSRNGGDGFDFALQENRIKVDIANPYLRTEQAIQDVLMPGDWHHIGFTFDGQGKRVRIYVDGVESAYNTTTTSFHPTTLLSTQANTYGNKIAIFAKTSNKGTGPSGSYTKGKIKTLRFWNKTLSATEMEADMSATVSAATPNLVAGYDFTVRQQVGTDIIVPDIKGQHPGKLLNFTID